jgi:adenylosuccinate lyase
MATTDHERETSLMAVTPIDGRYRSRTRALEAYFSEFALIKYRVRIEVEWYLALAAHPKIDAIKPVRSTARSRFAMRCASRTSRPKPITT